ncbi:MAG: EF-Tu/IF-2/RF-3 family GTPase [Thermoplasmata archaeon]
MKSLSVAVLGDTARAEEIAGRLGKKDTVMEITQYNYKKDERALTIVTASRFPERIQSLIFTLAMADYVVLVITKIDRALGETIIAIDSFNKKDGVIILENYLTKENLSPLIAGTCLEGWSYAESDITSLQEKLFAFLDSRVSSHDGDVKIPVDQVFNVRGVGTVVLGQVLKGVVRVHDTLEIFPTGRKAQVRSIQVHDHDVQEAETGSRVGLALKNVDVKDISKGDILAPAGSLKTSNTLNLDFSVNRYFKEVLAPEMVLHAMVSFEIKPVVIKGIVREGKPALSLKAGEKGVLNLSSEHTFAFDSSDIFILSYLEAKGPRIVGKGHAVFP